MPWGEVPEGGRYIQVLRDPRDALVSFYHFMEGWFFEAGSIDIDSFAAHCFFPEQIHGGAYWDYLLSWWPRRDDDNVLFLTFEDMRADPAAAIRRVAGFIGCQLDAELEAIVAERSSIEFMKKHQGKFDDHLAREVMDRDAGLAPGASSSKVRSGVVGSHSGRLAAETVDRLEQSWAQTLNARFGLSSYQVLRDALRVGP